MSISLQKQSVPVVHGVPHDLESFLWLLVYLLVRYRPNPPWLPTDIQTILCDLFDRSRYDAPTGLYVGGDAKKLFLQDDSILGYEVCADLKPPGPVSATLTNLRLLFCDFHIKLTGALSDAERAIRLGIQERAHIELSSHDRVMSIISDGVQHAGWNSLDPSCPDSGAEDQIADLVKIIATEHNVARLSSHLHKPSVSGTSKASSGSKGKRAHEDDKQTPQKKQKLSSRLARHITTDDDDARDALPFADADEDLAFTS